MKTFWQHRNGKLYALRHDPFGHIIGVAGPLDWENTAGDYRYDMGLSEWAEGEIRRHAMHRMLPALARQAHNRFAIGKAPSSHAAAACGSAG